MSDVKQNGKIDLMLFGKTVIKPSSKYLFLS